MKINKQMLNIKEVADFLGMHTSTIYRYAQQGKIPGFKIGADWRFSRKHIEKWIDGKVEGAARK